MGGGTRPEGRRRARVKSTINFARRPGWNCLTANGGRPVGRAVTTVWPASRSLSEDKNVLYFLYAYYIVVMRETASVLLIKPRRSCSQLLKERKERKKEKKKTKQNKRSRGACVFFIRCRATTNVPINASRSVRRK